MKNRIILALSIASIVAIECKVFGAHMAFRALFAWIGLQLMRWIHSRKSRKAA